MSSATLGSQSAQATDLLLTVSDVSGDTVVKVAPRPISEGGFSGATEALSSRDGSRVLGDTVILFQSAEEAATALRGTAAACMRDIAEPKSIPVSVGVSGQLIRGAEGSDHTKSAVALIFQEGRAVVTLGFRSAIDDPVPDSAAIAYAQLQDSKLRARLDTTR
jgi:hypothetical protein